MDKDDARTGSPSKGAGEKVTRRKPTVTRAPKAIIQKLLSRTLTKLRAILTELESRIKDPELRAALEQASGASALRVDLGALHVCPRPDLEQGEGCDEPPPA